MTVSNSENIGLDNTTDKLLNRYKPVADAITCLWSGYVEVVIHQLKTQEVVYIANNISKRSLGDASALDNVSFEPDETILGPYEKMNWDGAKIRSISVVLRDDDGRSLGVMCINMKVAAFEAAKDMLELLLGTQDVTSQPKKLFEDDWQERINLFVNQWLKEQQLTIHGLTHADKRTLVKELLYHGAFEGKSSANYIANVLNMGRATVFKYLAEIKKQKGH